MNETQRLAWIKTIEKTRRDIFPWDASDNRNVSQLVAWLKSDGKLIAKLQARKPQPTKGKSR